jgi:hypothetical protein
MALCYLFDNTTPPAHKKLKYDYCPVIYCMVIKFYDREEELNFLKEAYQKLG